MTPAQAEIEGLKATLRVQTFKCETAQKYALDLERQVAALRAENETLRNRVSHLVCGDCKVPYDVAIDNDRCDCAHRETWTHDWQTKREGDGWTKYLAEQQQLAALRAACETAVSDLDLQIADGHYWLRSIRDKLKQQSSDGGPARER